MTPSEREALVEQSVSAYRPRGARGEIRVHPSFADLDDQGRVLVFEQTLVQREMEAALDPNGLSTTVHAVLGRIRG